MCERAVVIRKILHDKTRISASYVLVKMLRQIS